VETTPQLKQEFSLVHEMVQSEEGVVGHVVKEVEKVLVQIHQGRKLVLEFHRNNEKYLILNSSTNKTTFKYHSRIEFFTSNIL
jgi:RNase P/RNase MRP subunit p29